MKKTPQMKLGSIHVSPIAIATIASNSLLTCYGVVGMASKNAFNPARPEKCPRCPSAR